MIIMFTANIYPNNFTVKNSLLFKKLQTAYALVNVVAITLIVFLRNNHNLNLNISEAFFLLIYYYVQMCLVLLSYLCIVHPQIITRKNIFIFTLPILLLTLFFFIFRTLSLSKYLEISSEAQILFISLTETFSNAIEILVALETALCIYCLHHEAAKYCKTQLNYFSDKQKFNNIVHTPVSYACIIYILLLFCNCFFPNQLEQMEAFYVITSTAVFLYLSIKVINIRHIYALVNNTLKSEESTIYKDTAITNSQNKKEDNLPITSIDQDADKENTITLNDVQNLIDTWESRSPRPYLRTGISLLKTAKEINIEPHLLSYYINNFYKLGFNTWINTLRINEIKKLIEEHPEKNFSEIAYMSGFQELSCMTRMFKKITGITPSNYRKQLQKTPKHN